LIWVYNSVLESDNACRPMNTIHIMYGVLDDGWWHGDERAKIIRSHGEIFDFMQSECSQTMPGVRRGCLITVNFESDVIKNHVGYSLWFLCILKFGILKIMNIFVQLIVDIFVLRQEQKCCVCEQVLDGVPNTLPCALKDIICQPCYLQLRASDGNQCPRCREQFKEGWQPQQEENR